MLFKIFLYFLYIMSLSIYIFAAYYMLAQVVSGWTPNLLVWGSNPLGSKQMGEHCSASDFRWPALTMRYIGKNRRFIANISREFLGINPEISPYRYFSMKYRVETLRYTIFSSLDIRRGALFNLTVDPTYPVQPNLGWVRIMN